MIDTLIFININISVNEKCTKFNKKKKLAHEYINLAKVGLITNMLFLMKDLT